MEQDSNTVELSFNINIDFLININNIMKLDRNSTKDIQHFREALELYVLIIDGISEGKIPALIDPNNLSADKLSLPPLLALFKHKKEIQYDKKINLTKTFL